MLCPECETLLEKEDSVLTDEGFIKVTPFYRCPDCKEEYYDKEELLGGKK